jgi:hypothetical protein
VPGNWPALVGKGPMEKDPRQGHLASGILHLTGGRWQSSSHGEPEPMHPPGKPMGLSRPPTVVDQPAAYLTVIASGLV